MLGLSGADPETVPTEDISGIVASIKQQKLLNFNQEKSLVFNPETDITFNRKFLPFHANGLSF